MSVCVSDQGDYLKILKSCLHWVKALKVVILQILIFRERRFNTSVVDKLFDLSGCHHHITSSYHPQGNSEIFTLTKSKSDCDFL